MQRSRSRLHCRTPQERRSGTEFRVQASAGVDMSDPPSPRTSGPDGVLHLLIARSRTRERDLPPVGRPHRSELVSGAARRHGDQPAPTASPVGPDRVDRLVREVRDAPDPQREVVPALVNWPAKTSCRPLGEIDAALTSACSGSDRTPDPSTRIVAKPDEVWISSFLPLANQSVASKDEPLQGVNRRKRPLSGASIEMLHASTHSRPRAETAIRPFAPGKAARADDA
jgi:hypothetical protein